MVSLLRLALGRGGGGPRVPLLEPAIWMRLLLGGDELAQPANALPGDGGVEGGEEDQAGGMTQLTEGERQFLGLGPVEVLAPVLREEVVLEHADEPFGDAVGDLEEVGPLV